MKKRLTLFMVALVAVAAFAGLRRAATAVTLDFTSGDVITAMGYELPESGKSVDLTEPVTYQGITITPKHGTTNTRFWNASGEYQLRYYNTGGMGIAVPEGNKINQIVINGNSALEKTIADVGTVEHSNGNKTLTWTPAAGTEVASVVFTNNGGKTTNVLSIVVDYEAASGEVLTDKTVTFINDANWEKVYVWAWNDSENFTGGQWPGVEITPVEGVYTWSTTGNPAYIIFSNGTTQTADLVFEDGATYNSQGKVVPEPELKDFSVTFTTDAGWEKVYAYAWNEDNTPLVQWPGVEITATKNSEGVYTYAFQAVTAPTGIIFNNGLDGDAKQQTADLAFENGKAYSYSTPKDVTTLDFTTVDIASVPSEYVGNYGNLDNYTIVDADQGVKMLIKNNEATNNCRFWNNVGALQLRVYNGASLTFEPIEDGKVIKKITFDASNWGTENSTDVETLTDKEWAGSAAKVVLTIAGGKTFFEKITVEVGDAIAPVLNTYTATFKNEASWNAVYAYAWTTTGEGDAATTKEYLGEWPGTQLTFNSETGLFDVTINATEAPANILFHSGVEGEKTADLEFENGKQYTNKVEVAPATISKVEIRGGKVGDWDSFSKNVELVLGEDGVYTAVLDLTELTGSDYAFKLVVTPSEGEPIWIGTGSDLVLNGEWVYKDPNTVDQDLKLFHHNANFATYTATATWNPNSNAASGWTLTIDGKDPRQTEPVTPTIPDGTYYVMSANEGTVINAAGALDAKGAPITFTFNATNNTYTIEGADFFAGKQWTIAAIEGMSGFYTISTTDGFLAASETNTLEQIADGTADAAVWILLEKAYWEDIVNSTYTVAGTKNLTGTENDWDVVETNQMTYNDETKLFEKTYNNITVSNDVKPEFKVVQTNVEGKQTWYPASDDSGDHNWIINTDVTKGEGVFTITITFDPSDSKEIGVACTKTGEVPVGGDDDPELQAPEGWTKLISNGNLAGDDVSSYYAQGTDPVEITPGAGKNNSRGIVVKTADNPSADDWATQFFIVLSESLQEGNILHVQFDYKAKHAATAGTQSHSTPGDYNYWSCLGNVDFTEEWQTFSKDIEISAFMAHGEVEGQPGNKEGLRSIAFNLAVDKTANEYCFDNFGVWYQKPAAIDDWTDIIVNGNMEGESTECFYVTEQGIGGPFLANFTEGIGKEGSKAVKVESYYDPTNDWDSQFFIRLPYQVPAGTKYKVSFDYKADKPGAFDTQSHTEPGGYIHWACIGSGNFTTSWQTYEAEGTISEDMSKEGQLLQTIAFNLGKNKVATCFVFDNVKFLVPTEALPTLILNPAQNPVPYTKPVYNSMAIVGDFLGLEAAEGDADPNWDPANGWQMTQDTENPAVWTFVKDEFTAEAKTYEYKATANGNWDDYVLPADKNADYNFDTPNLGAGKYKLTFTVDTRKHTVNLDVEKLDVTTYTATFTTDAEWEEVYAYAWSGTEPNVTKFLGDWPGTKLEKNAETGVYTVSIVSTDAPEMIIFNNGQSGEGNQTSDLEFVNGAAYEYKKPTGEEAPIILAPEGWTLATTNGNLAEDDASSYLMKEYPSSDIVPAAIVAGAGTDGSRGILVKAGDDTEHEGAQDWDSQFWIVLNEELPSGSKLHVEFDYKASEAATANTQAHAEPGNYHHWAAIGDVNFTTEWQHFSNDITVDDAMAKGDNGNGSGTGMKTIAFNLAVNRNAVDYQFDNFGVWYQKPVEIETMAIVGEFLGLEGDANWDPANGWQMEKDAENPAIWTLTKPFTAEAKTYEYKATANGKWGDYELPAEGNQNFEFGTEEYPAGEYNLTFTADTENNTLTLDVEKASIKTFTATFTTNAPWSKVYAYAWTTTGEGDQAATTEYLGAWPGTELTAGADDVYTVTIKGEEAPAMIVFSNGDTGEGNQTEDLVFEDGKAYEYVFTPTFDFENNNGQWAANLDLVENPITMDGVTLTGISAVKFTGKNLFVNKGSFKLTAPQGKSLAKVEFKVLTSGELDLTPSTGEMVKTMEKRDAEGGLMYSILSWTGETTELTITTTLRRNIGFINVTLEDAAIVIPDDAIVYDFAAAAAAGENPANKNGSAANGQAFYGWEDPDKTDSKRQDYKGYEWAEGSLLPEECHVWRRTDRINGNIVEGGLNCPNNREMAIDGLVAGDKVIIIYDATAAAEDSKEMIWAIGDGSSDQSLSGPRATATIGGVEAVTGTTTIASGAEILVNSVTPAENGTGYIVFQVKKGMIINQIAVIKAEEPALSKFYIIGDQDGWSTTDNKPNPKEMTVNSENGAFEYEVTVTNDFYFAFSDVATSDSWDDFNANNRYAIEAGETAYEVKDADVKQLQKANGTIVIKEQGVYKLSVSKDLQLTVTRTGDAPVEEADYYLTGTMTNWSTVAADLANYKLALNKGAEGVVEYMIKNVAFEASAQFKVIKVEEGKDPIWYPTGMDNNYTIQTAGNYDVYFRPNKDGGEGWHEGYIYATASLDKSALEDEIATATALLGDASTEEGTPGKALADAIAAAQDALQNATTQDEINNAVQALKDAEDAYKNATGIAGLYLGKYADGEWYTIQGVRIDRPTTKGLYIRNGRTVVVK